MGRRSAIEASGSSEPMNKLLLAITILLAIAPSAYCELGEEWKALSNAHKAKWGEYFQEGGLATALEMSQLGDFDSANKASIWYAENCLSYCHVGVNNFCSASQACVMSGFWKGKELDECKTAECLGTTICPAIPAKAMADCNMKSKELASFFNTVDSVHQTQRAARGRRGGSNETNSSQTSPSERRRTQETLFDLEAEDELSDEVIKLVAMWGHGALGCWRTAQPNWTLADYVDNMDTYAESVDVDSNTTGVAEMFSKLSEQSLVWEWTKAFIDSKCDARNQPPRTLLVEDQKTIVCAGRKNTSGGMTTESDAEEKFCYFTGNYPVTGCTKQCEFANVTTCLEAMFDDTHSCQAGGACCMALQGNPPPPPPSGPPPSPPRGKGQEDELFEDLLDLAEPRTFGEMM